MSLIMDLNRSGFYLLDEIGSIFVYNNTSSSLIDTNLRVSPGPKDIPDIGYRTDATNKYIEMTTKSNTWTNSSPDAYGRYPIWTIDIWFKLNNDTDNRPLLFNGEDGHSGNEWGLWWEKTHPSSGYSNPYDIYDFVFRTYNENANVGVGHSKYINYMPSVSIFSYTSRITTGKWYNLRIINDGNIIFQYLDKRFIGRYYDNGASAKKYLIRPYQQLIIGAQKEDGVATVKNTSFSRIRIWNEAIFPEYDDADFKLY